ncbi:hypothetical protein ACUIJ5_03485 [Bacillus toyonensis]
MTISNIRIGLFILAIVFVVLVFFYWRNEELYEEKKAANSKNLVWIIHNISHSLFHD